MNKQLKELWQKIEENKKQGAGPCEECPLKGEGYAGPVWIDYEGEGNPEIVIISESPAGFEMVEYDREKIPKWREECLKIVETGEGKKSLGKLLFDITQGKMVKDHLSHKTVPQVYWTHAVKCFIQRKGEKIGKAKERMGGKFQIACKQCSQYLRSEMKVIAKARGKLAVVIGEEAYKALCPSFKDVVCKKEKGETLKFLHLSGVEMVVIYHSGAKIKEKEYKYAEQKISGILR